MESVSHEFSRDLCQKFSLPWLPIFNVPDVEFSEIAYHYGGHTHRAQEIRPLAIIRESLRRSFYFSPRIRVEVVINLDK